MEKSLEPGAPGRAGGLECGVERTFTDLPLSSTPSKSGGQLFMLEKGLVSIPSEFCKSVFFLSVHIAPLVSGPPRMGGIWGSL